MLCKRCGSNFGDNSKKNKIYCSRACKQNDSASRNKKWKRRKKRKNPYNCVLAYREIILSFFGNKCSICNSVSKLQIHHIVPRMLGGKNMHTNIKILCNKCHIELHRQEHINLRISPTKDE